MSDDLDVAKLTVPQLREALQARGLSTAGIKAVLQKRLNEALGKGGDDEGKATGSKRKGSAAAKQKPQGAADDEDEEPPAKKTKTVTVASGKIPVDEMCKMAGVAVHEDYNCMLNQTNIDANNNKFYVIQLLDKNGSYHLYTRWGRVGEPGKNQVKGPLGLSAAIAAFEKQFKSKTANDWAKRADFKPKARKYTLIEMSYDTEENEKADEAPDKLNAGKKQKKKQRKYLDCTLPRATQELVRFIFDHDMFKETMVSYDIDVEKMPLGKLSKAQIARGFEVLEDIEAVLKGGRGDLAGLTSRFYTVIPHSFGRQRPPIIRDLEHLQQKKDMLNVLNDMEIALSLEKDKEEKEEQAEETQALPHPLDANYALMKCDLTPLDKASEEFAVVNRYLEATKGRYGRLTLLDAFKANRHNEEDRFAEHDHIEHRKLLWHGTNVAVVVAILSSGLRIMPHSGGRVGRGIYFASENAKSAAYVRPMNNVGIMFLVEVALGREHSIDMDDCTLVRAPDGYDSVVARGHTEPDPAQDTTLELDGKKVIVPQGEPIRMAQWQQSSFSHSEYLIYKESQHRIRYLLKIRFG